MTVLPFVIGFTLLFRSFQLLGFAFDLKSMKIMSWGNVALASVGGIIFSLLLIFNPVFTGISLVTLTGVSFIFMGIASIMLALDLRKVKKIPGKVSQELRDRIKSIQDEIDDLKNNIHYMLKRSLTEVFLFLRFLLKYIVIFIPS